MTNPCQGHAAESARAEHMKEAERLLVAAMNASFMWSQATIECDAAKALDEHGKSKQYGAALLAHIQRGAVPEGERAAFESWIENEAGAGAARRWLNTEAYENGRVQDYRTGWIACLEWLAAAPAPDQFRDAAKMMAAPSAFLARGVRYKISNGTVRGLPRDLDGRWVALVAAEDDCHLATAPAEVPMPEPVAYLYTLEYGETVAGRRLSEHQLNYPFGVCGSDYLAQNDDGVSYVRQTPLYTKDAEAAGYARGLKEAGRDAERYRTVRFLATAERDPLPDYEGDTSSPGAFDASIDRATAALRGEVK